MFSRFDTIHASDRQTDRQTELPWHIRAIAYAVVRKNMLHESYKNVQIVTFIDIFMLHTTAVTHVYLRLLLSTCEQAYTLVSCYLLLPS